MYTHSIYCTFPCFENDTFVQKLIVGKKKDGEKLFNISEKLVVFGWKVFLYFQLF